ncbi:amidohydrolase [Aureimonas sp. Leaf454]|uniref:amidohydrolase family protein n=1 Tax=Aureimonas sp. Leaf454 TaxID=1736381 RepID=UPI0006F8C0A1|nr:amidohydrolase family protein [Aureimonas sp. Leaf454]KQT54470.1 amidohydrolase [Aureimonas sp. Leaf454]
MTRFDLLLRDVRLVVGEDLQDIAIAGGRIAAIGPNLRCEATDEADGEGCFAFSGFVETHIHLDKAGILGRCTLCEGTLSEAVRETARAKAGFEEADVYRRASAVVEAAILHGTNRMRTFVEIDPRAGFRSFEAILRVKRDYAFAIDIDIAAFVQEGLTNEPETIGMLDEALSRGADLVGGCPYTDPEPRRHIADIFDLAERHGTAVDFHLDFDLDPASTNLPAVIEETRRRGWAGRVSIGHVTNLSAMAPDKVAAIGRRLARTGIALTVLPATDLFLNGRGSDRLVPRGIAPAHRIAAEGAVTSIASNNILNPFTPFGDASLIRMANLYANVLQLSREEEMAAIFDMVGSTAATLLGAGHGCRIGGPADIVLLDAAGPADAVRTVARAVRGWKAGVKTFEAGRPRLLRS